MNTYTIRCNVDHVLVVEAESEEHARGQAERTEFSDWNHHPSGFEIKEVSSPARIPKRVRQALRAILEYLWHDEASRYQACKKDERDNHIFSSLLTLDHWLAANT